MPARKTISCDVCATVVDFRTTDCGSSWEEARKAGIVFVCRICSQHEELKTEVVALRELVRELKEDKMVSMDVGVQTGTETEAGSVLGEDFRPRVVQTRTETGDSGELGSVVGPVEERDEEEEESEEEDDGWEEIDVEQGYVVSGRDGRVLYEEEIRRICVRTSNRFQILEDMGDDEDDTTKDEMIFMRDSIIRKIDGRCAKTKTTTVYLPGARVEDVRKRVGKMMGPDKGGGGGGGGGDYPNTCRDERRRQGRYNGATRELLAVGKRAEGQDCIVGNGKI